MKKPFPQYVANGKQVLEVYLATEDVRASRYVHATQSHYADAATPEAASAIAYALNSVFLAKLGKVHVRDPICPTCKGVGMHEPNCTEGRGNA